jgi:hypothetical protein
MANQSTEDQVETNSRNAVHIKHALDNGNSLA